MLLLARKLMFVYACLFVTYSVEAQTTITPKLDWVAQVGSKSFPNASKLFLVDATSDTTKTITQQIQKSLILLPPS